MVTSRKKYSAAFKAQVAIAALQERESLAELSKRFEISPTMISKWKQDFLSRSSTLRKKGYYENSDLFLCTKLRNSQLFTAYNTALLYHWIQP